jgi:hypothetical protein
VVGVVENVDEWLGRGSVLAEICSFGVKLGMVICQKLMRTERRLISCDLELVRVIVIIEE